MTGTPSENPEPKIITSMDTKTVLYDWYGYNKEIFLSINHYFQAKNIQFFYKYLSYVFNISNFAIYYIIAVMLFLVCFKRIKGSEDYFYKAYYYFVRIGICYAVIGLCYAAMKFTINMPRPFCSFENGSFFTVMDILEERCLSSFPSAHVAMVILLSYSLWKFLNYFAKFAIVIAFILVALSRIALAMHFPADIIYSMIIAVILIGIANMIFRLLKDNIVKYVGRFIYGFLRTS